MDVATKSAITLQVSVTLQEPEIRALEALAGYGDDDFLKTFYAEMGRAYLEPHEQGLRMLFKSVRSRIAPELRHIDDARKFLAGRGKTQGAVSSNGSV